MTDDRPNASLGMFLSRREESRLIVRLVTCLKDLAQSRDSTISFNLLGDHLQSKFAAGLESLLRASTNAFDIVRTKEEKLAKAAQRFGERGAIFAEIDGIKQDMGPR